MSKGNDAEKKLKRLSGAEDLSTAIKILEEKKAEMEDDFKDEAHHLIENLNPLNVLNRTLQNAKESSLSKYPLFKEALAFGAGYLSKRKLIGQLKNALVSTFRIQVNTAVHKTVATNSDKQKEEDTNNKQEEKEPGESKQTDKKNVEMSQQNQIEKVNAKPEVLPKPTYWPFFLAMGLAFLGWGLLTTWLISLAGFIILVVALTAWINTLRHE